uniref:Aldehyde dehydrogenase n=1 Tax=Meloidogyne incognita TaxID=6306 RepID=A0A914LEL9_MELIC
MSYHNLVESQREYFRTGKPAEIDHRKAELKRLRHLILDNKDQLCEAVYKDLKRQQDANYFYELASVVTEIDYVLENLHKWTEPTSAEKTLATILDKPYIVREPKGVVLIIGPWNYPLNTLLMPLVDVIAAGNTAVLKPSEIASNTAKAVDKLFTDIFDKRVVLVVQGGIEETTELLKERFDHIVFTGSTSVARIIMAAASKHLTPCTLELGGKSPVIVEPDADISVTASRLAWGKWLNCGQTCLAPDYVIVQPETKDKLVAALKTTLYDFYGEKPSESKDYSRIINKDNFNRLESLLSQSPNILYKAGQLDENDLFIPPIILDANFNDPIMQSEIFGPILPIITVRSFNEAIENIKRGEKPLAAYLFTKDESKVKRLLSETSSGSVCINDVVLQITVDTLPFGGIGNSGMGRYRGKFGFDEFTHEKAVLKRGFFGDSLASGRYPPLTSEKMRSLQRLTGKRHKMPSFLRFLPDVSFVFIGILIGFIVRSASSSS